MSDFRSYDKNEKNTGDERADKIKGEKDGGENIAQTLDAATVIAKAFSGKSRGDIWQTILAQAEQGKRNGTLTNEDLDNFYNTVSPLVDGFKRQKLKSVINRLKEL